jgi:hypothetical protein
VSKVLSQVSTVTDPAEGAVQLYQTVCSPTEPLVGRWSGSNGSLVAKRFVPVTEALLPLTVWARAKLSFPGGGDDW